MSIEVKNVSKHYGSFAALDNVSLTVPTGGLVALLGPSGSGKTTLLRIIAGLEEPEEGTISFSGSDATHLHVRNRNVGFVFQHYALFRHMNVFENIAFGLRVRPRKTRPSKAEIRARVTELLRLVQLEGMASRFPSQLSGGQRQRIALARALAVEPRVLLLDEPFGALDARVRQELRAWLRRLHDELHITSVFVTHDQEEALEVADQVVVMNKGGIEQIGTPDEVYEHPASPFVFSFLGQANRFTGSVSDRGLQLGSEHLPTPIDGPKTGSAIAFLRPHDIELAKSKNGKPTIPAVFVRSHAVGRIVRVHLRIDGSDELIEAELPRETFRDLNMKPGEVMYVNAKNIKVYAAPKP